jgi:hypothetical protein
LRSGCEQPAILPGILPAKHFAAMLARHMHWLVAVSRTTCIQFARRCQKAAST